MKRKRLAWLLILLLLMASSVCAEEAGGASVWQAYSGKRIGVQTGTVSGEVASQTIPDIQLSYYNLQTDILAALRANKIDAWCTDEPILRFAAIENRDLELVEGMMDSSSLAAVFPMTDAGRALRDQYSAFVDRLWADGTMGEIDGIWFGGDDSRYTVPDYEALPDTNGTLRMALDTSILPFAFVKDGRIVGYDVDIAARFCEANGYRLEITPMDFSGVLPSLQAQKADFAACGITVTEERAETMLFSSPSYRSGTSLAVLRDASLDRAASGGGDAITSLDQLARPGIRIAVGLNTPAEQTLAQDYPQAKLVPYSDIFLAYMDVLNGRVDACVNARKEMEFALQNGLTGVRLLDENYASNKIAVGISPVSSIPDLKGKINKFIAELKADGTLDDMYERWVLRGEETMPVIPQAENPSFTLRVGTTGSIMPYSYYVGTELAGYDIELAHRFAAWLGAKLEFGVFDFGGIVPAAAAGNIDCIMSNLFYTEEKNEAVPFSDVLFEVEVTAMVRDDGQKNQGAPAAGFTSLSQLNGKRIGVATGTTFDGIVLKALPDAVLVYINSSADLIAALESGKIDGFAVDEPAAAQFCAANPNLTVVDEYLDTFEFGFVLPKTVKGEALLEELNAWLVPVKESGALEKVIEKWAYGPEEEKTLPDYAVFPAPKGMLTLATEGDYVPMTYFRGNKIVGAEIDLTAQFCEANGYGLNVQVMNFDGILPAVQTGKADFAAAGISITDERRESVNFSVPYYSGGTVVVVLKTEEAAEAVTQEEDTSFWDGIVSSFNRTFIRENRWELFGNGVLTTLLITVLSILFGTALGFMVFMLCRNGNVFANGVTKCAMWLVQGMPMVVLLMILYYIIFGSVAISGVVVAVIGFTLTFGASVFGLLKMGIGTIDRGQYEAAYALGHSNRHTFFKIILPQAIPHILPAYQGEIVGLIKATAIVGYIAVQDLTKMGDIVRSRTYEAFFPLIAITVIYFVLEGLFSLAVSRIKISIDPKKRKRDRILKGDEPPTAASGRNNVGGEISRNEQCPHEADLRRSRLRESMIKIEHLKKEYPNITPLKDVSVEIHDGDVIAVIGPSGTGKSTLLRCINQMEKPTSGQVWVDGVEITSKNCDINKVRQKMGMVFQSFNLFGHLTVIENIMLSPMDLLGKSRQEAYDEGMRLLRTVGLAEKALNYPDELSGGQKQRIAIARTLAMDPDIILLDEPTSALDPTMVGEVQAVIRELAKTGKTLMIVTHEMNFARAISNRVFYMDEGGIYEDGTPEQIFDHPQKENTRRFIRKLKVLELNIENRDYDFLGMAGEIDQYCSKNQITPKTANRVHLAFEELVQQMLIPALEHPSIQTVIEYSEEEESVVLTVRYKGPAFDVTRQGDELSLKVLQSAVSEMHYTWNEGDERPNQAVLRIRTA